MRLTRSKSKTAVQLIEKILAAYRNGFHPVNFAESQRILHTHWRRDQLFSVSRILRESGFANEAFDLLRAHLREQFEGKAITGVSTSLEPIERAEYAACLAGIGNFDRSQRMFSEIPEEEVTTEIKLIEAYANMSIHRYEDTLQLIDSVLSESVSAAQLPILKLLKLQCIIRRPPQLITSRDTPSVQMLLEESQPETSCPRILAAFQIARLEYEIFELGNPAQALETATRMREHFSGLFDRYPVPIEAFLALRYGKSTQENYALIKAAERNAQKREDFSTLRSLDIYRAALLEDREALARSLLGCPLPDLRKLLARRYAKLGAEIPSEWIFTPSLPSRASTAPIVDVALGLVESGDPSLQLKPGDLLQKLLASLSSDFYGTIHEQALFAALYPGEHYLGECSSQRIHAVVYRLRRWAEATKIDLRIESKGRSFRIHPASRIRLRLRSPELVETSKVQHLTPEVLAATRLLQGRFSAKDRISTRDVGQLLGVSSRTSVYRVKALTDAGVLIAEGNGPRRRYRMQRPVAS